MGIMVQKIVAMQKLLSRGTGPSYKFVSEQLVGKRKARRKSSFIKKKQQYFPHSSLLNQLILKFLKESSSRKQSVRERMASLVVQNDQVGQRLSLAQLETVCESSVSVPNKSKGKRMKVTVKVRKGKKSKKT